MVKFTSYREEINLVIGEINGYVIRAYTVPIGEEVSKVKGWNVSIVDAQHKNKTVFRETTLFSSPRIAIVSALATFLSENFDLEEYGT